MLIGSYLARLDDVALMHCGRTQYSTVPRPTLGGYVWYSAVATPFSSYVWFSVTIYVEVLSSVQRLSLLFLCPSLNSSPRVWLLNHAPVEPDYQDATIHPYFSKPLLLQLREWPPQERRLSALLKHRLLWDLTGNQWRE